METERVLKLNSCRRANAWTPAVGPGLTAATAVMVAHVLLNAPLAAFVAAAQPFTANWKIALLCFIVS